MYVRACVCVLSVCVCVRERESMCVVEKAVMSAKRFLMASICGWQTAPRLRHVRREEPLQHLELWQCEQWPPPAVPPQGRFTSMIWHCVNTPSSQCRSGPSAVTAAFVWGGLRGVGGHIFLFHPSISGCFWDFVHIGFQEGEGDISRK